MSRKAKQKPKSAPKKRASKPSRPFWRAHWVQAAILLLLPFLLYGAALQYGYLLDDKIVLSENSFVQQGLSGLKDIFGNDTFTGFLGEQQALVAGARYRPLSLATFALEYHFLGLSPKFSHFVNVLLYGLTGLLLFRVFSFYFSPKPKRGWYLALPFLTALLFVLHPVHTEVVANIKGRDEILALLFALLAWYCTHKYWQGKGMKWLAAAASAFFLGLLAKENTITFLAVVPLAGYFFTKVKPKQLVVSVLPLIGVTVLYLVMRVAATGHLFSPQANTSLIMNNPFMGASLAERYATITYTLGLYLKLLVFPHPLTHDYYPYHIPILNWGDWRVLLSLLLHIGLAVLAVWGFRQKRIWSWAILFYAATLSIVSNVFFSVGAMMNERFIYMSSVGFCLLLSWLLASKLAVKVSKPLAIAALSLIGLGYAYKTVSRVPAWENEYSLNFAAVQVSQNSARANQYMGYTFYRQAVATEDAQQKRALLDKATPYVDKALSIIPSYQDAIKTKAGLLAGYYQMDGQLQVLLDGFASLLQHNHVNFIDQYMEYLNPRADQAQLLDFYHRVGFELFAEQQQQYELAEKYINYGLSLDPNNQLLLEDRVGVLYLKGDRQRAVQEAQRALGVHPNSARLAEYLRLAGGQ
jgi:tetratricopeptide (TPR) repeat protein